MTCIFRRMTHQQFRLLIVLLQLIIVVQSASAAEKLVGIHSARLLSQSMPWIAQEPGPLKRYQVEFPLVFIASSPVMTAAILGGDAEIGLSGATIFVSRRSVIAKRSRFYE